MNAARNKSAPQHRACDDPHISATRFLVATMHDKSLDIHTRIRVATELFQLGMGDYQGEREFHITINGGLCKGCSNQTLELEVYEFKKGQGHE
jgi:hypothetical protein